MTLNITVLTTDVVYQSADFRLSDPRTLKPYDDPSDKTIHYVGVDPPLHLMITYTGIGAWGQKSTGEYVAEWLANLSGNAHAVGQRIEYEGTRWLSKISRSTRQPIAPHTFVVCGFDGDPFAAVISNFETVDGPHRPPRVDKQLGTSTTRFSGRRLVVVTGYLSTRPAVAREQRRALISYARHHGGDSARIRIEIERLNAAAAKIAKDMISPDCAVSSLDRWGRGERNQGPPGTSPRIITGRINLETLISQNLTFLQSGQMRGITFGSSAGSQAPKIPCSPEWSNLAPADFFDCTEMDPSLSVHPSTVSPTGSVAGTAQEHPNQPGRLWCFGEAPLAPLPVSDGLNPRFSAFSGHDVVGHVEKNGLVGATAQAIRWNAQFGTTPLEVEGAVHSAATTASLNVIAGWASFDSESGQDHQQAVRWCHGCPGEVVSGVLSKGHWAVAANTEGDVLVVGHDGWPNSSIWLWLTGTSDALQIDNKQGTIYPIGLDDRGRILGREASEAVILDRGGATWNRLGLPPEYEPTTMGSDGTVGGRVKVNGWARPWILPTADTTPVVLPHYAYHHAYVSAISSPYVAGSCSCTAHGSHALLWRAITSRMRSDTLG